MQYTVLYQVFRGISICLTILQYVLLAYCVMSWVVRPTNSFYQLCQRICEPLLAPFRPLSRKLIERGFMIDISALLAFFILSLIQRRVLWWIFSLLV